MKALYALVGMKHRGTEALVASLSTGAPLILIREPTNRFDPNAIQVWSGETHVGFIKKEQAVGLARLMDQEPRIPRAAGCLRVDGGRWPMVEVIE